MVFWEYAIIDEMLLESTIIRSTACSACSVCSVFDMFDIRSRFPTPFLALRSGMAGRGSVATRIERL